MYRLLIFLAVLIAANANIYRVNHRACSYEGNESKKPTGRNFTIDVSGCTNPDECALVKTTNHDIRYCFECARPTSPNITMIVTGILTLFSMDYKRDNEICNIAHLSNGTTCASSQGMEANQLYCLETKFPVYQWFPTIKLQVQFVIKDDISNEDIACVIVPVSIVSNAS
uniref:Protein NPC2 n=1 Tax=Hadrurus spadix TaxID=141984 RepID=A0A1W7RA27_9SCOR